MILPDFVTANICVYFQYLFMLCVCACIVPVELFLYRERLQQQNGDMRKRDKE
jgi:hypothetical protein